MFSSKDEVINLVEYPSPAQESKTWKRRNKIGSPLVQTPNNIDEDSISDISNIFSVKSSTRPPKSRNLDADSLVSTSEISDEVFLDKPSSKSYKERIRDRFHSIKTTAGTASQRVTKNKNQREKLAIERLRRESNDIEQEIESVRSKFQLGQSGGDRITDFFLTNPKSSTEVTEDEIITTSYSPPESLRANLQLAENESLFYPSSKIVDIDKKIKSEPRYLEDEGIFVNAIKGIPSRHINLIESRLILDENCDKWFDCKGDLNLLQDPNLDYSLRPEKFKRNENLVYYIQPTEKQELSEIVTVKENLLELNIASIKFNHHPLFSLEHVLAKKVASLYETYESNLENNNLQRLENQLNSLRHVKKNVEKLQKESSTVDNSSKIENYTKEINLLRALFFEESKNERVNLKLILENWKLLKKVRATNKYSSTPIKILIKKEKVDYLSEKNNYDESLAQMFEEIIYEHKSDYKLKLKAYKKDLDVYKKRTKSESEEDIIQEESELDAPEKPIYDIDEEKIRMQLAKQFQESFKPPGEPIIKLLLTNDNEMTKEIENANENTRRNIVNATKLYAKIICNKLPVCKSKKVTLTDEFVCHINESFSILLLNVPKVLEIEIFEQHKLPIKRKICEISINLPPINSNANKNKILMEPFEKLETINYKHEGVGSGVDLKYLLDQLQIENSCSLNLNTSGFLEYSIGWDNVNKSTEKFEPEANDQIIDNIIEKTGGINLAKLDEWMQQTVPDPQDPKNSILYEYTSNIDQNLPLAYLKDKDYFRLNPYARSFQFCDVSVLEQNIRLKILQLRNQNEVEFDGMLIPNRIKEIPFNILADYKRRLAIEKEGFFLDDEDENEADQRSYGQKYLKQVQIKVFQECKSSQHNLCYEDVVDERYFNYFEKMAKTLLRNIFNWFRWHPNIMHPLPILDRTDAIQSMHQFSETVRIYFEVKSAKNVPKRKVSEGEDLVLVQPLVEINYNGFTARTTTASGVQPSWNEILTIPLESQNTDYLNPNSLVGTITVNLFDELEEDGQKLHNWLGMIELPLSSLCSNNGMEGYFKLKLPQLLLGYETELDKLNNPATPKNSNFQSASALQTYIEMKINIAPIIPKLSPNMEELPCSDLPYLKEYIVNWNAKYNENFPGRKFSALAIDTNAKTTCITRYINAVEPPQINADEFDVTADQCARFVSLIPFTECNQVYQNIWLTTDQLLKLMLGSVIDHAVALTCYLLALKMNVWLVLGYGIPMGNTAYVLVREDQNNPNELPTFYIYDVTTNDKYNVLDVYCPLKKIYCIINKDNLWANTQRGDNLSLARFDLTRGSDWLALFNNKTTIQKPSNSLNVEITYGPKYHNFEELEARIERKLKHKIGKLRQLDRTVWNHKISNAFKHVLKMLELNTMYNKSNQETIADLNKMLAIYNINGHVINLPYTSISSLIKRVKSYEIHQKTNAEFALAVYIHAYPAKLLSLWLFIAHVTIK